MGHFGVILGVILGSLWGHFGGLLASLLCHFLGHFGVTLGVSGALLGSVDIDLISRIRFSALELLILAPFQDSQIQDFCRSFSKNSVSVNSVL